MTVNQTKNSVLCGRILTDENEHYTNTKRYTRHTATNTLQ